MRHDKYPRASVPAIASAIIAAMTLSGCSSSNQLISSGTQPVNGAPIYRQPPPSTAQRLEDRAQQIYSATGKALEGLIAYAKLHPDEFEDVSVQKVGATTEVKFVSSKKGFFPAGIYVLNRIEKAQDRHGVVFTDLVVNATREVLEVVKGAAGQVEIEATYAAQADGLPVRNLRYRGEFGALVNLPPEITSLNGKPATIRITKGQSIDNVQLAALRAVSLSTFVHGALNSHAIKDRFVLTTTNERGIEHRWVELTVKIAPAP